MYTRQQLSKLKEDFWTRFGQYMQPVSSATGEKVNWVNYKTGLPNIRFVMDADRQQASIAIVITHGDSAERAKYFNQLKTMKPMLLETTGEEWEWKENDADEYGKSMATISCKTGGIDITDQSTWPVIISFLKLRIIALDAFWADARFILEML
ncbi:MAG: DUF4268 domain-containing protein [Sphingobacteriales bacterium]|nr:MAG: DUF4268 domain-containing protein [Sphingobacteriales bacterium]